MTFAIPLANADVSDVEAAKQKLSTTSCRTKGAAVRCTCSEMAEAFGIVCGQSWPVAIRQTGNPTIRQSNNPTIRQWPTSKLAARRTIAPICMGNS